MALTKIKEHKGTAISVDGEGRFSAKVNGRTVTRKELRAVEREIEAAIPKGRAWPGESFVQVSGHRRYANMTTIRDVFVSGYRRVKKRGYEVATLLGKNGEDLWGEDLFRPNAEVEARLKDILARMNALDEEWNSEIEKLGNVVGRYEVIKAVDAWEAEHRGKVDV